MSEISVTLTNIAMTAGITISVLMGAASPWWFLLPGLLAFCHIATSHSRGVKSDLNNTERYFKGEGN